MSKATAVNRPANIPLLWAQVIGYGLASLNTFFALWTVLTVTGMVPRQVLPTPADVLARAVYLISRPFAGATLLQHLVSSFQRYAMGVLLAMGIGVPVGLLMSWFRWLDNIVTPIFDGLRFIAPIA
jgi:ABC-type nitrate/sulfonate/bicarbonate transport system permease component